MTRNELEQYIKLGNQIKTLQRNLDEARAASLIRSPKLTGMPRSGGGGSSVEDRAIVIADLEADLECLIKKAKTRRESIVRWIRTIDDYPELQTIVIERYMLQEPWRSVAKKMGEGYTDDMCRKIVARYFDKKEGD